MWAEDSLRDAQRCSEMLRDAQRCSEMLRDSGFHVDEISMNTWSAFPCFQGDWQDSWKDAPGCSGMLRDA